MTARIIVLAALLTAACGGPYTLPAVKPPPVAWSSMVYAAKDGPILVETSGGAFMQPTALAPLVAEVMTGSVLEYPTTFTADPARAPHVNFRTVMVFNPAPALTEAQACAGNLSFLAGAPPGRVTLFGAFCNGSRPLVSVQGAAEGVSGPTDPRFVALVRQSTRDLFRRPRPEETRGDVGDIF